jgi:hypothetical protein
VIGAARHKFLLFVNDQNRSFMDDKKNKQPSINQLAAEAQQNKEMKNAKQAKAEAEKDLARDAGMSAQNENDDLDEGETARLGEDKTDLV